MLVRLAIFRLNDLSSRRRWPFSKSFMCQSRSDASRIEQHVRPRSSNVSWSTTCLQTQTMLYVPPSIGSSGNWWMGHCLHILHFYITIFLGTTINEKPWTDLGRTVVPIGWPQQKHCCKMKSKRNHNIWSHHYYHHSHVLHLKPSPSVQEKTLDHAFVNVDQEVNTRLVMARISKRYTKDEDDTNSAPRMCPL